MLHGHHVLNMLCSYSGFQILPKGGLHICGNVAVTGQEVRIRDFVMLETVHVTLFDVVSKREEILFQSKMSLWQAVLFIQMRPENGKNRKI